MLNVGMVLSGAMCQKDMYLPSVSVEWSADRSLGVNARGENCIKCIIMFSGSSAFTLHQDNPDGYYLHN